jgi:hypothetical protein
MIFPVEDTGLGVHDGWGGSSGATRGTAGLSGGRGGGGERGSCHGEGLECLLESPGLEVEGMLLGGIVCLLVG